jgi:uncharacterized protein YjbI with pentapeptide repeats
MPMKGQYVFPTQGETMFAKTALKLTVGTAVAAVMVFAGSAAQAAPKTTDGSSLTGSSLTGSSLTGSSLTGSSLTGSSLTGSSLTGSSLT